MFLGLHFFNSKFIKVEIRMRRSLQFFWKKRLLELVLSKSFIHIRKKRGPKTDTCGAHVRIYFQSEVFPLRVNLWTLSLRKLLISSSRFPLISFCFNLNNKPSCHTLSKVFDISKNTTLVFKERIESKLRKMSCVTASNW